MNLVLSTETGDSLNVQIVAIVISAIMPLLVGLVTKRVTSSGLKSILLVGFTGATSFITELVKEESNFSLGTALLTWMLGFVVAIGIHLGFYRPTAVTAKTQEIGNK